MKAVFVIVLVCALLCQCLGKISLKTSALNRVVVNHSKRFSHVRQKEREKSSLGPGKQVSSPTSVLNGLIIGNGAASVPPTPPSAAVLDPKFANVLKLMIGAGGIYAAFLYYGALQEDVFHYVAPDGSKFKAAWFLQAVEALANVVFGLVGLAATGWTPNLPLSLFGLSGVAQVSAKAFTSLALASGVSFPLVTLAKSGKMVPVMLGSLLLGGATYSLRQYLSVAAIIAGTVIVSLGNKSKPGQSSSLLGLAFIVASLACDGVTGGIQKRLKTKTKELGIRPQPADFMFWTNLFMSLAAAAVALVLGEFQTGLSFTLQNPVILGKLVKFAICSAVGQAFIFYTISEFDPLVCSTVTTTRKVFSVLLSIFTHNHAMSYEAWGGIALAFAGILSELFDKKH